MGKWYNSFINDEQRLLITRWRLSNHNLLIERGKYVNTPRSERKCRNCNLLEDEHHIFFNCFHFINIRQIHSIFCNKLSVFQILNPQSSQEIIQT